MRERSSASTFTLITITVAALVALLSHPSAAAAQVDAAPTAQAHAGATTASYDSIRVDGISLAYRDIGEGEPLVLLHGFIGSGLMWDSVGMLEGFASRYRVIVPDLRGRGRSVDAAGDYSPARSADDVLALLDHLDIPRAKMLGSSFGALSLLHLATSHPERVEAMVLISGGHYLPVVARDLIRNDPGPEDVQVEFLEQLAARHNHVGGVEQARRLIRAYKSAPDDYEAINFTPPYLSTITARTLIVHGDRDPLFPIEIPVEMYRSIPDASLWILPGVEHDFLSRSEEWTGRILETSLAFFEEGTER